MLYYLVLGRLLKSRGLKAAAKKLDPYINVDPGTMSPYQHGEVYMTEDGVYVICTHSCLRIALCAISKEESKRLPYLIKNRMEKL